MSGEPASGEAGFIYLHGFASSPGSAKARAFCDRFARIPRELAVPDLADGDFEHLTLTRQVDVVSACMDQSGRRRFGLIGSSMGGYLAALVAEKRPEVEALYLMAPGFGFLRRWREKMGWDAGRPMPESLSVFHYGANEERRLSTRLFVDAEGWEGLPLLRPVPTRIVHGVRDDTVPVEQSRAYARSRPWCSLRELDADHGLVEAVGWIVDDCVAFFASRGLIQEQSAEGAHPFA